MSPGLHHETHTPYGDDGIWWELSPQVVDVYVQSITAQVLVPTIYALTERLCRNSTPGVSDQVLQYLKLPSPEGNLAITHYRAPRSQIDRHRPRI